MANKGRIYAENLVGPLDRSAYNQQRTVAQNTYDTNWQNVQNQYRNLQEKLKLQQERSNRDFAEGLVNAAEGSFNRQRTGSANLANRGLMSSGLNDMLSQTDIMQKGEDIGKLLKSAGDISTGTADKLSQANAKFTQEGTNLMGRLADTLADIGDTETAAQNRYNQTLANIAGAMDEREANNEIQAMQRAASRASNGTNREVKALQDELEEFYKRATISEILTSPEMTDLQKKNYLGIMFGIDNADKAVTAYNNNVNAAENYDKKLKSLKSAADVESVKNRAAVNAYNRNENNKRVSDILSKSPSAVKTPEISNKYLKDAFDRNNSLRYIEDMAYPTLEHTKQNELNAFIDKGITYEDLARLLYGNR